MEWISIEEKLPERQLDVIGSNSQDEWVGMIYYDGDNWYNNNDFKGDCPCYPTHWMPLPEPPKI